ncbi:MAG: hypothetical protein COU31_00540 [Candidatus Magasanikbacteria bacterium CG10_big_fil_rev_8_21_14_0_10_40_10]|uniref:Cell division protein FtsL n=1 Tax=Candidatus Magasanikbacteria bacterium CG10_big_fil_rev_8_21_14_0_10_40_10 TaxID=1974648 RepID=A0A2M6W523_9BACT|nr:MAG: hypothetical protein COU31_00540 [Candidatus Magasanikbacteria bacterium CG10_big_fil_rev_8_21_14_0_10_40_10]
MLQAVFAFELPAWLISQTARIALVLLIIAFGSAYIFKTASTAATGYEMYELQNQQLSLEAEIKQIEAKIDDYSSLASIKSRLNQTNMAYAINVSYYEPAGKTVAKK